MVAAMTAAGHHAHDPKSVTCAIVTVSDTRTVDTDRSGQSMRALLDAAGHRVGSYVIVPDEPARIGAALADLPESVEVVLITGGTGIAARDTTYEAVSRLIDKEIHGFGELFRMLSYAEIGSAAMLSRAVAGVAGRRVLFAMPGSTAAVELAMERLILPQLGHVAALIGDRR